MSEEQENHDYNSKPSVRATGSVQREKEDPKTGLEPLSIGLFASCAVILMAGGSYLGAKSGSFDFSKSGADIAEQVIPDIPMPEKILSEGEKYIAGGEAVYKAVCNGCHQANGGGQGQIPPLVDSEWAAEGTERFAQIILNGIRGPITVNGASYGAQEMPAQKGALSDLQIGQVMTYVRVKFNGAPMDAPIVTKEMIADARSRFGEDGQYTVAGLSAADVMLPGDQPEWAKPETAEGEGGEGEGGEPPTADAAP